MNRNVKRLLKDFQSERQIEQEHEDIKRERLIKGIDRSTNKAYLLVWKSILDQYRLDLEDKKYKDNYYVTINTINLDEMIYLAKRKVIRANVKYLEELKECSNEILGAEIDYNMIYMVFPDILNNNLEEDNFEPTGNNTYRITTEELKYNIECSARTKKQKRKTRKK